MILAACDERFFSKKFSDYRKQPPLCNTIVPNSSEMIDHGRKYMCSGYNIKDLGFFFKLLLYTVATSISSKNIKNILSV